MTYLQTHKRPYQRRARLVAIVIGVVVAIAILLQLFMPHFFPGLFTSMFSPFWRAELAVEMGSLRSPSVLLAENEQLKRDGDENAIRMDTIRAIELENQELKALLGREISPTNSSSTPAQLLFTPGSRILAAVLKRPPLSVYDEIIIDVGRDHAVSTSSLVYATGNILIGRVVDVLGSTSKVRLFSSPQESYEILIGSTHAPATASGRGGGQYEAQVSRDTTVNEGDFVLNPTLYDRPFGIVSAVLSDPTQPFKTVLFAPPVNIYQLRWVLVEKK